ncbi:2-hydroxychromene-2-carboxylate isomerase [Ottowia testudinis]|uniref:2-hydroxychromene-2-carboxylate isomerase n=1 Tax=Ottowia testudinis TaxID=2816950 RepID=A0A975CJ54_9BURK|nr:2-hydroxychromene-2-carboxylate isomerase [Ottowia testudinis]QTD45937.1 2-hydroxychromene-2-carboxylate isomerase [Ottowia testudinis]
MKLIDFYLDFISPYAYLAFEQLPRALQGLSYEVVYHPVLFAGMLKQHGQLGPAEIAPKRDWTYRQVAWLAQAHGIPLQMPAAHPFNPLALLRLALACARQGAPNRFVCETIFHHVWRGGAAADDAGRLAALTEQLAPARDAASGEIKQALQAATQAAIGAGVFGVPSFVADGRVFWGFDALPMLRAQLEQDARLDTAWATPASVAQGARR